jgi:hypothetical protein
MDKDGSGQVDATGAGASSLGRGSEGTMCDFLLPEFSRSMAGSGAAGSSAGMFTVMDKDQNGLITFEEILRETYKKAGPGALGSCARSAR